MYNIAIIEDDLPLRKSMSYFFDQSDKVDCVLAVDTVEKFLKFHRDFMDIHLILLDVMIYGQSSILDIPLILQRDPNVELVMFTVMDDADTIFQALCNGATGYLLKDTDFNKLENQIISTLNGEGALLSPNIARKVINYFTPQAREIVIRDEQVELSEKENTVVTFLKDGASYQEIAQYMGITLNGVRYYVKSIYRKLKIKSKGELWKVKR
jgi:DNA-binding NarL/FixJ family response regulator